jgi:uncharacterized protein involved in exopolysaccharide biosynthesis
VTAPAPPSRGFDPEAEQEVDFAKYVRLLGARWWLLAAGLVAGAVIGYLVSLGGSQVYSATATLYLGQPYSPTGGTPVQDPQTNPSAVGTVIQSRSVDNTVANRCSQGQASAFKNGISTQVVNSGSGSSSSKSAAQVTPLVKVSVQAKKGKVAACAANALAQEVVKNLGTYPARKIANLKAHIAFDNGDIRTIQAAIANPGISATDKLILQTTLRSDQLDKTTNSQLLLLATQVESPKVLTHAASQKVTARSRRNTVVIAGLIGLILGALAALLWDSVVPRLVPRNGD